jgi:hypothetical protein
MGIIVTLDQSIIDGDPRKVQGILIQKGLERKKCMCLTHVFTMQFHFLGELRFPVL